MIVTTYLISNVRVSIEFEKKLNTFIIAFLRCYVQSSFPILYVHKRTNTNTHVNEGYSINDLNFFLIKCNMFPCNYRQYKQNVFNMLLNQIK